MARIASVPITTRKLRQEKKKIAGIEIVTDPEESAEEAGLRYVSDESPGYTRQRRGKKFIYFDTEGKRDRGRSSHSAPEPPDDLARLSGCLDLSLAQRPPAGHRAR